MTCQTRWRLIAISCLVLLLGPLTSQALSHAVLVSSIPAASQRLDAPPSRITLAFSETITLLAGSNVDVVDEQGRSVAAGPGAVSQTDKKVLELPLRSGLVDGTYTTRFSIISADAHAITGQYVFRIGDGQLRAPVPAAPGGPSETSVWSVSARFFELVCLGGLLGMLAFRWLVWRPTWLRGSRGEADVTARWASGQFWAAFAALAVLAVLAEVYLLVTKSASALGKGVAATLADTDGITRVLGATPFGDWLQLRTLLLFGVFAVAVWEFLAEPVLDDETQGEDRPASAVNDRRRSRPGTRKRRTSEQPPTIAGRPIPALIMSALLLVCLVSLSMQGHASTAPLSTVQITADTVHLAAVSVWIGGLAMLAWTLHRLPHIASDDGPLLSATILARFSQVATVAVVTVLVTGTTRAIGELSGISQLWGTTYGRSILLKVALLAPIGFLALRNRRVVAALAQVRRPNRATIRKVRTSAAIEFSLALVVVIVASVLVAQVPGRVA